MQVEVQVEVQVQEHEQVQEKVQVQVQVQVICETRYVKLALTWRTVAWQGRTCTEDSDRKLFQSLNQTQDVMMNN